MSMQERAARWTLAVAVVVGFGLSSADGPVSGQESVSAELGVSFACVEPGTGSVYHTATSSEWSWSPDGRRVVYDRAIGAVSQLRVLDLATDVERCITSGAAHDSQPSWSPSGDEIAFVRGGDRNDRILVMNLVDGSVRPLTGAGAHAHYPAFSRDGQRLAYVRYENRSSRRRFVVVRQLSNGEERVVFDSPFGLNNLAWSADDRAVLLYSIDDDGWNDLYAAQADGSGIRRLTDNTVTDTYSAFESPDGARLVFGQGSGHSPYSRWFNYDLYEQHRDSDQVRRLTWAFAADDRARYSPDGGVIGFMSRRSGYTELWVMNADGTRLRPLTAQPAEEITALVRRAGVEAGRRALATLRAADPAAIPFSDRAVVALVQQLLTAGRTGDAVEVGRMGAAVHGDGWRVRTALGQALLAAGDEAEARAQLTRSLSLQVNQVQVAFMLGSSGFVAALDQIEGVYARQGSGVLDLVHRLQRRGELLTALLLLRRLDAAHPDDTDVLARLARTQMMVGDEVAARATFERVLGIDPAHEEAIFHLARLGKRSP